MKLGYARSASDRQHIDLQIEALKTVGCQRIFTEIGSGLNQNRPQLTALLSQANQDDIIYVWNYDRLTRSAQQMCEINLSMLERVIELRIITRHGIDAALE